MPDDGTMRDIGKAQRDIDRIEWGEAEEEWKTV